MTIMPNKKGRAGNMIVAILIYIIFGMINLKSNLCIKPKTAAAREYRKGSCGKYTIAHTCMVAQIMCYIYPSEFAHKFDEVYIR